MSEYWFKPKMYGYGASPATREGWIATIAYIVAVFAVTSFVGVGADAEGLTTSVSSWITWAAMMAALTGGFVWLAKRKTEGQWRWRWGNKS